MDWYIRDIVLYGEGNATRIVTLGPGVNVITGASKTGKSALIPIVDYCLGASYEVPVGVIRNFTEWYAVRLQTPDAQIFVARREPGSRSNTSVMHILIDQDVPIPPLSALTGNTDRDSVVKELSARLGLMQQALSESRYDTAFSEPPTFRNVVPFLFQPQNVIANKDTLFYKTDQERHKPHGQRLLRIFPYVLGAIDAEYFGLNDAFDREQRILRQMERSLAEKVSVASQGTSVARSLWDRAAALGLVGQTDRTVDEVDIAVAANLTRLVESAGSQIARRPLVAGDPARADELAAQSRELRTEVDALRRGLAAARELADESHRYEGTLQSQAGRLRAVEIVENQPDVHVCPVCDQHLNGSVKSVETLRRLNDEVRLQLNSAVAASPPLAAHIKSLEAALDGRRALLASIESSLAELYAAHSEASSADDAWAAQQRHIGAIRFYLERAPAVQDELPDYQRLTDEQRRLVGRLREELDTFDVADRLDSALGAIARTMSTLGQDLSLERPDAALRLDIKKLTVVRDSPEGRPERLYEIGSGENWVGYHLCALLALHSFFIRRNSPVPSFLFLDQPSQIYFPEQRRRPEFADDAPENTDWQAVETLYHMIFSTVADLDRRLQVIILDHADLESDDFQAAVRYRWRGGLHLI